MSVQPAASASARVTAAAFASLKGAGRPIVVITAYDYHGARLVDEAGVDAILVGDSLGMTVLGHASTLPVTMEDMARHTAAVSRAATHALVIADMPFMSYQPSLELALLNAGRLLAEAGAQAVKIEGGGPDAVMTVEALVEAGVPVMGHVGLTPQSINVLGGYSTQAKNAAAAATLLEQCLELQEAGAFGIVLECIPVELAARATELVTIPTIGIGAGVGCDGQVQVFHDLLGIGEFVPRHAKRYADLGQTIRAAVSAYSDDVRDRRFPGEEQSTHFDAATLEQAEQILAERREFMAEEDAE